MVNMTAAAAAASVGRANEAGFGRWRTRWLVFVVVTQQQQHGRSLVDVKHFCLFISIMRGVKVAVNGLIKVARLTLKLNRNTNTSLKPSLDNTVLACDLNTPIVWLPDT